MTGASFEAILAVAELVKGIERHAKEQMSMT